MTDPDTENTLRWLAPILTRRREDGAFAYSDEAVRALIPPLLISLGFDPAEAPPWLAAQIGAFARAAGVVEGEPKEVVAAKLRAHLDANPLDPQLLFEVARGLREELATYSPEEVARDMAVALGLTRPTLRADGPPPEGSVRAGPLARFALEPTPAPKTARRGAPKKRRR